MENLTENYSPGDSFLGSSEEFLSNVKERDKDICEHLLEKKKKSVKLPKSFTNHQEYTSQIDDFSNFICIGRFRNLDSLRLFLKYAS